MKNKSPQHLRLKQDILVLRLGLSNKNKNKTQQQTKNKTSINTSFVSLSIEVLLSSVSFKCTLSYHKSIIN